MAKVGIIGRIHFNLVPMCVWKKFDVGQLGELLIDSGIEDKSRGIVERMAKVALLHA